MKDGIIDVSDCKVQSVTDDLIELCVTVRIRNKEKFTPFDVMTKAFREALVGTSESLSHSE